MPAVRRDVAGALARGRVVAALRMARTATRRPDLGAEKIVSRRYRYVWICNPKVASRSIKATLCRVTPDAEVFSGMSIGEVFAARPEARRYYAFAFTRHPYARALSFHAELHCSPGRYSQADQARHKRAKASQFFREYHGLADTTRFDEYCRWLITPYGADAGADRHYLSQHLQVKLDDGRLPAFLGRLETLDEDFRRVARRLGLPGKPELPLLNTMAGWQADPVALEAARSAMNGALAESSKALLRARYATDFELGGYVG